MADLKRLYYSPEKPHSYGGARGLFRQAGATSSRQKNRIRDWLSGQEAYTLYRGAKTKFARRPTLVSGLGEQLQADLLDVHSHTEANDNINFLLVCIDVFSRVLYVSPLISKSASAVERALRDVLDSSGHAYRFLQTDKGKEFLNRHVHTMLKEMGVKHFSSENDNIKASLVERVNQTLRTKNPSLLGRKPNRQVHRRLACPGQFVQLIAT